MVKPAKMTNKQKFLNKLYIFSILCLIVVGMSFNLIKHAELNDYYYMKATGDYLITNHFSAEAFHTNPFTVNKLDIIIQQWAHCVVLSFVDAYQPLSLIAFILFNFVIYFSVLCLYGKVKGFDDLQVLILITATIFMPIYIITPRPEILTIALLFLQIIITEQAMKKNQPKLFYLLPLIMLFEINFHGSCWIFHYLFLAPYVVPSVFGNLAIKHSITDKKNFLHLGIATVIMTGAMFINPYGIKMPLYIVNYLLGKTFTYIKFSEMAPAKTNSPYSFLIYIIWIALAIGIVKKKLRSSTIYFTLGLTLISLFAPRNHMFLPFPATFIISDFLNGSKSTFDRAKISVKAIIPTLVALALLGTLLFFDVKKHVINENWIDHDGCPKIEAYLSEKMEKDTPVFVTSSGGSYLEYKGYTNIYMDTRPEVYIKRINNKKDVLKEYDHYCRRYQEERANAGKQTLLMDPLTAKEMEEFIESYQFRYFVVNRYETILLDYLSFSERYEKIMTEEPYCLFVKKK